MNAVELMPSNDAPLFATPPHPRCIASVVIPARNEEASLAATLDALRCQVDGEGNFLDHATYEVLLLLNNCTDGSADEAERYRHQFPHFALHFVGIGLPPDQAHVGTARKLLMDAACERMERQPHRQGVILSTDADTLVAPDWIARNLLEIERGAEVVGGVIHLLAGDEVAMDEGTRSAYDADRLYQRNVAWLEALLDPDPADPWPRHLQHFGASLACTCAVYRRSGGLPAVKPLEDVAFIDALRKVGARIRHSPNVFIHTSARLEGRAEIGLSGQLRHWQQDTQLGRPHLVQSCAWLEHRFGTLALLRRINDEQTAPDCNAFHQKWRERLHNAHAQRLTAPRFLEILDCNAFIAEHFTGGAHQAPIGQVNADIEAAIHRLSGAPARPPESADAAGAIHASTPAG